MAEKVVVSIEIVFRIITGFMAIVMVYMLGQIGELRRDLQEHTNTPSHAVMETRYHEVIEKEFAANDIAHARIEAKLDKLVELVKENRNEK